MTGFKLDFEDKFEGGVQDGTYEVVVNNAYEDATPNGAEFTQVDLIIRNDIEQKHRNMHIFHRIFKKKDTGRYNFKMFNTLGYALNLQEGKQYNGLDDLLEDFIFKTARVTVKNEESESNGKVYQNLNVKRWERSKFPELQHQFKEKAPNFERDHTATEDVSDDSLPF